MAQDRITPQKLASTEVPSAKLGLRAFDLLSESYGKSQSLFGEDRAYFLGELSRTASRLGDPDALAWAKEGLSLAVPMSASWDHVALQKNFITSIASLDPAYAMAQLRALSTPAASADVPISEDLRAFAARTVFISYWNRYQQKGLDEIIETSTYLGQTGQFPFAAMRPIIKSLSLKGSDDIQLIFSLAASYIDRNTHTSRRRMKKLWTSSSI